MFRVLIFFLLFFTRTASAQMAVIDTNGLAESIKQNATMAAILENGKAIWDTTDHGHGRQRGFSGVDGAELYHERQSVASMRHAAVPFGRYEF